ncbi:MAG: response regulator [Candidatus Sumerlaeaceae bacterium]|nr:response regulator [Candidatus Sumerlaeaceae bacterium]
MTSGSASSNTPGEVSRILAIEDDPGLGELIARTLRRCGHEVVVVATGREALDQVAAGGVTLLLVDYVLPDMNACTLIHQIHEQGLNIPFIIATGQGSEQVAVELMRSGARDYLVKDSSFLDVLPHVVGHTLAEISREARLAEAEKSLRESERRLSTLLANLPGMAYRCKNSPNWEMEFVSEGCLELTGYSPAALMPGGTVNYGDLIFPQDREMVWNTVQSAIACRRAFLLQYRIVTAGGDVRHVWERGRAIINPDGSVEALEGFISDITARVRGEEERRRLEAKVLEAQKLESLGILAGGIAHDFNNLLTSILGNTDLALADLPRDHPVREYLESVETAARRAAELCRQMLAYSGRGKFVMQHIDLNELVREMSHLLRVTLAKKASLKFNLSPGLPTVWGDATQLRQVIMNLITNASEAIGEETGSISVGTGLIQCDTALLQTATFGADLKAGPYVFLEVTDTGCGMGPDTLARIFDPFFSTKFTGRGLGLAAVLGIVRGHGGAIQVHSEKHKGTRFKVLLPACEEQAQAVVPTEDSDDSWTGYGTVLLADDDESVRVLGRRLLERLGFEVIPAADGREAVATFKARADGVRLVLLDLTMPRMDGIEAMQAIRQINPQIPIIISSGYNEDEMTDRLSGEPAQAFIQKPYQLPALRAALRRALAAAEGDGADTQP